MLQGESCGLLCHHDSAMGSKKSTVSLAPSLSQPLVHQPIAWRKASKQETAMGSIFPLSFFLLAQNFRGRAFPVCGWQQPTSSLLQGAKLWQATCLCWLVGWLVSFFLSFFFLPSFFLSLLVCLLVAWLLGCLAACLLACLVACLACSMGNDLINLRGLGFLSFPFLYSPFLFPFLYSPFLFPFLYSPFLFPFLYSPFPGPCSEPRICLLFVSALQWGMTS